MSLSIKCKTIYVFEWIIHVTNKISHWETNAMSAHIIPSLTPPITIKAFIFVGNIYIYIILVSSDEKKQDRDIWNFFTKVKIKGICDRENYIAK